jgi:hypoxanthine phosphoribosyltransferase
MVTDKLNPDVERVLLSEEEISNIVDRLSKQITEDYKDSKNHLVLVCILKGSILFFSDLIRKIDLPAQIECMKVSSYGAGSVSSGKINVMLDFNRKDIADCDLLVIEDIVDSGNTLYHLTRYLKDKGAASVKTCTLLDKPDRRVVDYTPDYVGTEIPDEFVIGYGLDYAEAYRTLPYVGILKRSVYSE